MGMESMRTDGKIALDVLCHFAGQRIPALGVHDSFIVRISHEGELRWAMDEFFLPANRAPARNQMNDLNDLVSWLSCVA